MKHITIYLTLVLTCTLAINVQTAKTHEERVTHDKDDEQETGEETQEETQEKAREKAREKVIEEEIEEARKKRDEELEEKIQEALLLIKKLRQEADKIYYLMYLHQQKYQEFGRAYELLSFIRKDPVVSRLS